METPQRPDRSLPSPWTPQAAPPAHYAAPAAWEDFPDPDAPAAKLLTPRLVVRAFKRYWWQIALLWMALSAVVVGVVHSKVKPTYEATAWLKVEPTSRTPLTNVTNDTQLNLFMETQVKLVTSPDVLNRAITKLGGMPIITKSSDPEKALRDELRVMIPKNTNLILISMSSTRADEAAKVVAVVRDAYLDSSKTWLDNDSREQIAELRRYKERFTREQQRLRDELKQLADKGAQADPRNAAQDSLNRYRSYRSRLDQVELEIMDAEATQRTLTEFVTRAGGEAVLAAPTGPVKLTDAQLDELVKQAFMADPQVVALHREMVATKQRQQAAQRISAGHDPAAERFRRDYEALKRQNDQLWSQMRPMLRQQLAVAPPRERPDPVTEQLTTAKVRLEKLQAEKAEVEKALNAIKVAKDTEGNDAIKAQFTQEDLSYVTEMLKKVTLALEDTEYEAHGPAKITKIGGSAAGDIYAEPKPNTSKRLALMAGGPIGVLAALLALFTLLEARGARVADPDELSSRLRLGVIGVVPPLPSLAPPKGTKAIRDQRRRLEEFVQSLDHLRVTLCSTPPGAMPGGEARRCVMITSAVGGEGKTTLAAQLAGRCANAGLTTLLVDADLRRPSLGELLEVPEGPGLAEVLLGEATPEEAMVVIGNAGGFHLLPAGSAGHDPSRLLQGERLGQLIARLREAFDVVLIDAPPVLPVPDALLVGRWTDGAVVAVRHDSSRFPLVERAQKRLTSIGVPLLGAVVNGVRPAESNYGAYDYYATTAATREVADDV